MFERACSGHVWLRGGTVRAKGAAALGLERWDMERYVVAVVGQFWVFEVLLLCLRVVWRRYGDL